MFIPYTWGSRMLISCLTLSGSDSGAMISFCARWRFMHSPNSFKSPFIRFWGWMKEKRNINNWNTKIKVLIIESFHSLIVSSWQLQQQQRNKTIQEGTSSLSNFFFYFIVYLSLLILQLISLTSAYMYNIINLVCSLVWKIVIILKVF